MPNYRNKNKNKKNKNRSKKNNQNKNPQQNDEQKVQDDEELFEHDVKTGTVSNKPTEPQYSGNTLDAVTLAAAAAPTVGESKCIAEAATGNLTSSEEPVPTNDTVCDGTASLIQLSSSLSESDSAGSATQNLQKRKDVNSETALFLGMGNTSSKVISSSDDAETIYSIDGTSAVEARQKTKTIPHTQQAKVVIHRVVQEANDSSAPKVDNLDTNVKSQDNVKVIFHRVLVEEPFQSGKQNIEENYKVESPLPFAEKSVYNRDVQIQEVSDESSGDYNDNPPLVSEVESESEITVATSSSSTVHSTETEEDEEEDDKCQYAQQDDLKQRRLQKRVALETHFLPQLLSPRYLDSIVEENSDMSDARSDCSDNPVKLSGNSNELDECGMKSKKANAIFPKSNLDFSKKHKHGSVPKVSMIPGAIREEPIAMILEAKLIDQTNTEESCTRLSSLHTPESEAAEVVYINSNSSSLSDLMELDSEDTTISRRSTIDLDTDVREIISKPLDTSSRESTPVNQVSPQTESALSKVNTTNDHIIKNNQDEIMESEQLIDANLLSTSSKVLSSENETMRIISASEERKDLQSSITNSSTTEILTLSNSLRAEHIGEPHKVKQVEDIKMNKVREIVNTTSTTENFNNDLFKALPQASAQNESCNSPPPIPPPPRANYFKSEHTGHTIFNADAFSTHDNLKSPEQTEHINLQTQELPHCFSSLKSTNTSLIRQESTDSHCSDSTTHSQCTAINVGSFPSPLPISDFDVTSFISDNTAWNNSGTRADADTADTTANIEHNNSKEDKNAAIKKLRLLCTETLASMPYGEEVLEELATVAQNIGEVHATKSAKMPYPLPDLPHINDLQLSIDPSLGQSNQTSKKIAIRQINAHNIEEKRSPSPPPVPAAPNTSSNTSDTWLGLPTDSNSKLLVCLSPSQQSYIKDNSVACKNNADQLLDAHQKFIERRGYHEFSNEQVKAINCEKIEEQQILQTAAIMKKLRKSLTPPPIPPPPVPSKSSETAAKAQKQTKAASDHDASYRNANEQIAPFTDGEEEKHRLLAIIHDTNVFKPNNIPQTPSSLENNSRQLTSKQGEPLQPNTTQAQTLPHLVSPWSDQSKLVEQNYNEYSDRSLASSTDTYQQSEKDSVNKQSTSNMQTFEGDFEKRFPLSNPTDIFDIPQRRFSNIESSSKSPYCSQILNTQPKRYSTIEKSSYESKKRIENGQVVYDFCNSNRESHTDGDKTDSSSLLFPFKDAVGMTQCPSSDNANQNFNAKKEYEEQQKTSKAFANAEEIMSAFKLNPTNNATTPATDSTNNDTAQQQQQQHNQQNVDNLQSKLSENKQERREHIINRQQSENSTLSKEISNTYEEFRQRAKTAAETASSPLKAPPATYNEDKVGQSTTHFDHEKLFKDFDDLSKQLHMELESGNAERVKREKSASLYDLSKMNMHFKHQFEDFKKERHEHMQELEREIDRSIKSRQFRNQSQVERMSMPRTFEIPINIENSGNRAQMPANAAQEPRTREIPVHFESEQDSRFRRAESMFNLTDTLPQPARYRTPSVSFDEQSNNDDWARYSNDFGLSENITRPFAREVEICYQRQRPNAIRAPRMCASTNDLSATTNLQRFDNHNAYNVRRTHAPMLSPVQQKARPQYLSCTSMIERNPNPTYISTTSRRGVSPAPPPPIPTSPFAEPQNAHSPEIRQRRASLPREIHEQQLKYITSKEEELKTEFDRLQNERRRLMGELSQAHPVHVPQRSTREMYRPISKLPTLSEDEVFRQQMAEEWLNKVAEREERRLQKIIKISKVNENNEYHIPIQRETSKPDISNEFLSRVKERRSKLSMPADSDWESGAESQSLPQGQSSETEEVPAVKIIEGKSEADLRQLPRHLREFAKFSSSQTKNLEDEQREVHQEEQRSHAADNNSESSAIKKTSVVKTIKISRLPATTDQSIRTNGTATGQGRPQTKLGGYQSEPEPNYDSDYATVKYRTLDRRRLHCPLLSTPESVRSDVKSSQNDKFYGTMPNPIKSGQNSYKNQPGRIEDYVTGHSSVSEKEKKEWWDEVMDIFNGHLDQSKLSPLYTEGNLSRALAKDSGYTSDSNLVFRKKEIQQSSPLSPVEQKLAYKSVQAGGEPPLFGFRKSAPEKPKDYDYAPPVPPQPPTKGVPLDQNGNCSESPNRYYESDVNIHFKTPVRHEFKVPIPEEELAMRQAEQMQKLYQEERRRKYLQELQDMNSRRHTDNFTPTQKSPIPLNRYDDFPADLAPKSPNTVKQVARALYNFQGQSARELSFRKGDVIYIRRQIDKNWYEGEHNASMGLLPANYVEIINRDGVRQPPRKPSEGQARAKYNFQAQSGVELTLNKGELVTLTRRVDDNWFEGKIANRKGIFPVAYVEVLTDIGAEDVAAKTVITEYSTTTLQPSLDNLRTNINNEFNIITQNGNQPPNGILKETKSLHKTDALHVDTSSEPLRYRALYKYRPQNSDELELLEGDLVQVLEKCDDGWFVGTSQRTGCFGTFPGNYVERA